MREKNVTNRVIAYVNENIQSGNWKVGDKLPSEHEICNTLDVSRISVRSALQHFIALGVLRSVQGKGTFLINDDTSAFAPSLAARTSSTSSTTASKSTTPNSMTY